MRDRKEGVRVKKRWGFVTSTAVAADIGMGKGQ